MGKAKIKMHVLLVSQYFPATHIRKGDSTNFLTSILEEIKIHTLRMNYDFWKKRIDEVNKGLAILSVRYWSGKPYKSNQIELIQFDLNSGIGIEKLEFVLMLGCFIDDIDNDHTISNFAKNDGLSDCDFKEWFKNKMDIDKPIAIIHFTKFRYGNPKEFYQ